MVLPGPLTVMISVKTPFVHSDGLKRLTSRFCALAEARAARPATTEYAISFRLRDIPLSQVTLKVERVFSLSGGAAREAAGSIDARKALGVSVLLRCSRLVSSGKIANRYSP